MDAVVKRRLRKLALFIAVLFAIFALPRIVWTLWPQRTVDVVIVDKTVPFAKYREHEIFFWLLEAWKIAPTEDRFLDPAIDYVGFDPVAKKGTDLDADRLKEAELLFIADTYGVYTGDYEMPDRAALERSPKIYGGLSDREAAAIESFLGRGCTVIAEFNTFASPTADAPRKRMETAFGVRWTGWVARYWPNVQDKNEVPPWIPEVFQRVFDKEFDVVGPALIFVREDSDMVVLQPSLHFEEGIATMVRTTEGADLSGLPSEGEFYFWLDVLEATGAEVLYEYQIEVNREGAAELAEHSLPHRFPAVTRKGTAYYLAGDMVDASLELGDPRRKGLLAFRRARAAMGGAFEERLVWGWYAPVIESIVDTVKPCR